jgi:DNA-binding transcriptional ArsR family regulator
MVRPAATADVFTAVADPTRRRMLELLADADRPVQELATHFAMSQPSVSGHLRVLRDVGLVSTQRSGRQRVYRLRPAALLELADWVRLFERFWNQKLNALDDYLRRSRRRKDSSN